MLVTTATELPRLMVCIGSRLMPAALPPDYDREQRDEGNAAHWLAQQGFNGSPVTPGTKAPNGYVITDDMCEHVRTYLSALDCGEMECDLTFAGVNWEVRARADHVVYQGPTESPHGTGNTLTVDDFKYGYRIVEPESNWTLIAYAIGWCIRNNAAPANIVLRIHQPRPYHPDGPVREWRLTYVELMTYYAALSERLGYPDDTLATSAMCAKCHALPTCSVARAASMNSIDATGLAFSDDLPNDILTFEYETLKYAKATIENRFEALEELMTHRVKNGNVIKGYGLKPRYANRAWLPGLNADALSMVSGADLRKIGTVTPAEAERRGVPKEIVNKLTDRPLIGTKLERIDADKIARKAFGTPQEKLQ